MELTRERLSELAAILHLDYPSNVYKLPFVDCPRNYQTKLRNIVRELLKEINGYQIEDDLKGSGGIDYEHSRNSRLE